MTTKSRFYRLRAVGALLGLGLISACGAAKDAVIALEEAIAPSTTEPARAPDGAAGDADESIQLAVCVDRTDSVERVSPGLADQVPAAIGRVLADRNDALDRAQHDDVLPGAPALRVSLSSVAANSFLGRPVAEFEVPGVMELRPVPADGDPETLAVQREHGLRRRRAVDDAEQATAAAIDVLDRVAIPSGESSDVAGCVGAEASRTAAPGSRRLILYVGDAEQIGPPRWPTSFEGIEVRGVLACARAEVCAKRWEWLTEEVTARGGSVRSNVYRPEDVERALADAIDVAQ